FNDPVVGVALKCLHAAPLYDWSVESLARQVGVSRSVLADRFRHFLEQPPMQYLAGWRLQLAAQQLKSGRPPVGTVAARCGSAADAAYGGAVKRRVGAPAAEWRGRQAGVAK